MNPSDRNLKNIHGTFNRGLDELVQISPVSYNYKSNNELGLPSDKEYTGLIAQEVQKVIPEAVEVMESGHLAVNNDPVIWTMLNAIKEQNQRISNLVSDNQSLKIENDKLNKMMIELSKRIEKLENQKKLF